MGARNAPIVYIKWKLWIRGRLFFGPHTSNKIDCIPASRYPAKYPGSKIKMISSQKSTTIGINTKHIAIPQTHKVTARRESIYLNDGVAEAAPAKNAADLAVNIHETVETVFPKKSVTNYFSPTIKTHHNKARTIFLVVLIFYVCTLLSTFAANVGKVGPVMLIKIPIAILAPVIHTINKIVAVFGFILKNIIYKVYVD